MSSNVVNWIDITSNIRTKLNNMGYDVFLGSDKDFSIAVPWNEHSIQAFDNQTNTYFIILPYNDNGTTKWLLVAIRNVNGSYDVINAISADDVIFAVHITSNYIYVGFLSNGTFYINKYDKDLNMISQLYSDTSQFAYSIYVDEENDYILLIGGRNLSDNSTSGFIVKYTISSKTKTTLYTSSDWLSPYIKVGTKIYVGGHGNNKAVIDISDPSNISATDWTGFNFTFSVVPLYYDSNRNSILVGELGSATGSAQSLIWYNVSDGSVENITKPTGYENGGTNIASVLNGKPVLAIGEVYYGNGPPGVFLFDPSNNGFTDITLQVNGKVATPQSNMIGSDITSFYSNTEYVISVHTEGSQSNTVNNYIYVVRYTSPKFQITNYTTNISVNTGEQFNVSATIENIGDGNGEGKINLYDNNSNLVDSKAFTLDPNQSTTLTLTATAPSKAGTYTYTLEAYNNTTSQVDDSKDITVNVLSIEKSKSSGLLWLILVGLALLVLSRRK